METTLDSPTAEDAVKSPAKGAQRTGGDLKSDFGHAVNRGKDAAKDLGDKVRGAAEDAAASGRDIAQEYVERGKRRLTQAAERVTSYADDNTAIVAVGAFVAGVLVGYLASRR